MCGKLIIVGLLSSSGDTNKSAKACDCATILDFDKAFVLKNAGYTHVGRYLTGTGGSTTSRALTRTELNEIFRVGLRVFTIYQDGGASSTYFNANQGKIDAEKAVALANNLEFKNLGYKIPNNWAFDQFNEYKFSYIYMVHLI